MTEALETMIVNAKTLTTVPMKIPANCAMNCLRGLAPSRQPLLKSVSKSAAEVAAPAGMFALIRFTFMLPGLSAPNVSGVTLPIAPMGVVSVSPVTRHATSASAKDITTASALCQYGIPNDACASSERAMSEMIWPAANQDIGVSMASISVGIFASRENNFPKPLNADRAMRHCRKNPKMPDATMHDAPPQSVHCTTSRKPLPVMTPACCMIGTNTAQQSVPPSNMLMHTRIPVIAPAAMKIGSQLNITVRPTQAGPNTTALNFVTKASLENGASLANMAKPSCQKLSSAARTPAMPSAFAARI